VTSVNGQVEKITARVIHIYPVPSFEEEKTVFPQSPDVLSPAGRDQAAGTPSPARDVSSCERGGLFCVLEEFFQQVWTDIRVVFP
jgi:hypothetical protein